MFDIFSLILLTLFVVLYGVLVICVVLLVRSFRRIERAQQILREADPEPTATRGIQ